MTESPLVVKDAALEVARLIEEAEQVILADIADRMAMGEDMTDPQWRKRLLSDNEAIKRDVEALFADLDEEAAEEINRIFTEAYEKGWKADEDGWSKQGFAVSDWESLKSYMPTGLTPSLLRLAAETKMKVGSMTRPILRQIDDFYRQAQGDALKRAMTQGMTRIQATQQMMNRLPDKSISNFIDKAGRQWDAASYAEMAIRTGAMHCYREGFIDSVVARGYNLVYISYHPGACPLCRPWQNKVLQIADAEERQQSMSSDKKLENIGEMWYNNKKERGDQNVRQKELFEKIDHTDSYSPEYKQKMKDTYLYFAERGIEFREHGINRVLGQKTQRGQKKFTNEEILHILEKDANYIQDDGKLVYFYDGISVVRASDTGEVVSIVVRNNARSDWKER